ncbi:unnamed protein product [Hyaloperonospora brassicae]|uniref:RxLR effector candidate protein n=1 Tax=Hyaloperonospora brassicae TaxID=162125 RepID=A0AAV0TYV0_HYABA|nr:unnamed protein product [Hyaloperonospora brassicae]
MRFQESFLLLLVIGVGCYGTNAETEASMLSDPKTEASALLDPKTKASMLPDTHLRPNRAHAADDRRFHEGKVHASNVAGVHEERNVPSFKQVFGVIPTGLGGSSFARGSKKLLLFPVKALRRAYHKGVGTMAGDKRYM